MSTPDRRPMTLTQKILAQHAVGLTRPFVQTGDVLRIRVDWTIASELAWNGMNRTYDLLGRPKIHDKDRFYLALDHTVDPITLANEPRVQKLVKLSRDFAKEAGLSQFYDANQTIMHTKFYRELVQPGEVVLGADSHTSSHGGLGAFAIGLGGADVTVAMVLGESWIEVPEAIAVEYTGSLPFGIGGKDVILKTLGTLGRNTVAMERTVEFVGDAVSELTTDMRFTIANMTAEFGGLNGIFTPDAQVATWLQRRSSHADRDWFFRPDEDAPYADRFRIELDALAPQVAKPFSPDNVWSIEDVAGQALDGAFIGACTTTEEELVLAGLILELELADGKTPVESNNRIIVPGDLEILENLKSAGLVEAYEKAGFRVGPPGCSMCLGIASDKAQPGEIWLSSQNRNFENRMGAGSLAWLASGATVAASAMDMKVHDPRPLLARVDPDRFARILGREASASPPEVHYCEPDVTVGTAAAAGGAAAEAQTETGGLLRGRVQHFGDHVDTDAMIPGEFCHLTDLTEIGDHAFYYVRPQFAERSRAGRNIVVAGEGWGSGSSREHAVWALKGAGIIAVIARSYAFIHKRNLVNEALPHLIVRDDRFYELAQEDAELTVDPTTGKVTHVASGEVFQADPPSTMVRALTAEGGIVPAIQHHGDTVFERLTA